MRDTLPWGRGTVKGIMPDRVVTLSVLIEGVMVPVAGTLPPSVIYRDGVEKPLYYVYMLTNSHGVPFYIGMGKGGRILQHEREAREGNNSAKCVAIRKLWASGEQVHRNIVHMTFIKQSAMAHERYLIEMFADVLTNINLKGERGDD